MIRKIFRSVFWAWDENPASVVTPILAVVLVVAIATAEPPAQPLCEHVGWPVPDDGISAAEFRQRVARAHEDQAKSLASIAISLERLGK